MSPAKHEAVYAEVDEMWRLGVIEERESVWNMALVMKPGKNRLCLDARRVNKVTKKDAYPIQNIDGILSRIASIIFISSVDLKHAYWQIELDEESRPTTEFTVPGRPLYQFAVMHFGLKNAGQSLCRLMDKVIPSKLREKVFVYLDDLLIVTPDFERHLSILKEVGLCYRPQ